MILRNHGARCSTLLALALSAASCSKSEPVPSPTPAPAAPSAAAPAPSGKKPLQIAAAGTATFLIDAPLEKIKGRSGAARGTLYLDTENVAASTGQIEIDLADLKTETFTDAEKNKAQTEHSHNWLEIGPDVDAKRREENRWARFTIKSLATSGPAKLAQIEAKDGERTADLRASGDLWLHGASSPKTVGVSVTFVGPPEAPTAVRLRTAEPLRASLKEHDVKPRDLAGKFLAGALEKIGQKIDDTVQISLELTAKP